jgi:hypothetical protein
LIELLLFAAKPQTTTTQVYSLETDGYSKIDTAWFAAGAMIWIRTMSSGLEAAMALPSAVAPLIEQIHAAPTQLVLAFAGAGSQALYWLHAVAGSSRTIIEAIDCYAPRSLADFIGHAPSQAVAAATGHAMATAALARARNLSDGSVPLLGIGVTAAISTDRHRRGANQAFVAVHGTNQTWGYHLRLASGHASRSAEEKLVSMLVIHAVAAACGIGDLPRIPLAQGDRVDLRS